MISNLEKRRAKNCPNPRKVEIESVAAERDEVLSPKSKAKKTIEISTSLFIDPKRFLNRRRLKSR